MFLMRQQKVHISRSESSEQQQRQKCAAPIDMIFLSH
jgi:hypothetical protein